MDLGQSPFPLPLRAEWPQRSEGHASRHAVRRNRRRGRTEVLVEDAVSSLNALFSSRAGQGLVYQRPRRLPRASVSECQDSMLSNIARTTKLYDPPIPQAEFEEGALEEVLKCRTVYDVEEDTSVAPFVPERLPVLVGRSVPKDARNLVGDLAR